MNFYCDHRAADVILIAMPMEQILIGPRGESRIRAWWGNRPPEASVDKLPALLGISGALDLLSALLQTAAAVIGLSTVVLARRSRSAGGSGQRDTESTSDAARDCHDQD
jgi:hypothetical protein